MFVLQISPQRMGSTWQFNVAKELLESQSSPVVSSFLDLEKGLGNLRDKETINFLFKSHSLDLDKFLALSTGLDFKVLITCRNLYDTIKSSRRVFPGQADETTLNSISNSLYDISNIIEYGFSYHLTFIDEINSNYKLFLEIQEISRFLGLKLPSDLISEVALKLSKESIHRFILNELNLENDFNKWDEKTQWHGNHILLSTKEIETQGLGFFPRENNDKDSNLDLSPIQNLQFLVSQVIDLISPITQQRDELTQQRDELTQQRDELTNSTIWKTTKYLRVLIDILKKSLKR
jgi:hypothetical protein